MIDFKQYEYYQKNATTLQFPCEYQSYYQDGSYRGTFKGNCYVEELNGNLTAFVHASCIDREHDPEISGIGGIIDEKEIYIFLDKYGCKKKEYEQLSLFDEV